ncbi:MAG: energy-coupling factor transporter ATPase [Clostridia bacterium]|nr:energy-coupling factor transporter ATPase [Clostridia bacterium]
MSELLINVEDVSFSYGENLNGSGHHKAVNSINLSIEKGDFLVVLGRNGSGKSTLARLMNTLLLPTDGTILIKGMNTKDGKYLWEIRRTCGMVFQNPDNQILGTSVEEDVAFGPENLGVPPDEIRKRVDESLKTVGILEYAKVSPGYLSGGQKQRVAIAGILAMRPECIILDEATAMLDPIGRRDVMKIVKQLNQEEKITVIHITHHMDEASKGDKVIVVDKGEVVLQGTPREVFSEVERIKELGLDTPQVTELFHELKKEGFEMPEDVLTLDEAEKFLLEMLKNQV